MKKSIIILVMTIILSVGIIVCGCIFVDDQIGEAVLTEKTITGDKKEAEGLVVGFRADSSDDLHWINSYDYSTDQITSSFTRGEMNTKTEAPFYDNIRFTGWSTVPYYTQLKYEGLDGLQDKKIHAFYEDIQQSVIEDGKKEQGKIKLADYIDYYPVSFRFQLGSKIFSSNNALTGMKVYDGKGVLNTDTTKAYSGDIDLYVVFNNMFTIPIIENEYHQYDISKVEDYDHETELEYKTEIKKLTGANKDYYEFDPIIAVQEENIRDGVEWDHPDLHDAKNNLKNRLLFVVNNKTAKGKTIDTSKIKDGYGIYELPVEIVPEASLKKSPRSRALPAPKPLPDQLKMVYPLDAQAEYVEMSLSNDHRYIALFYVKEGTYYVEMIDADRWTSEAVIEMFPASEKMTYTWGDDGSVAATNHNDYIAIVTRSQSDDNPFEILYRGKVDSVIDEIFFDRKMVDKKNSYAKYEYGIDEGLAIAVKDDKTALVQNSLVVGLESDLRNAEIECLVVDKSGIVYRGKVESNIVDYESDMIEEELSESNGIFDNMINKKLKKKTIVPVRSENWVKWE